jgi:uncharacterized protein
MPNRSIIHIDIPSRDQEESGRFYQELFGWTITPVPAAHYTVWQAGEGSRGGFPSVGRGSKAGDVRIYVASEDIDADLQKARELGAEVVEEKTEIPQGWHAVFRDPTGNLIGLWTRKPGM